MKRPMLYWVILFVLGEVLERILPISQVVMIAVLLAMGICWIPVNFLKQNKKILLTGLLFFLTGGFCFAYTQKKIEFCGMEEGKQILFSGVITEMEFSEKEDYYIIKSKTIEGEGLCIYIRISLTENKVIAPGSRVEGSGEVKLFSRATNPGGYDEQSYQYGKGIFLFLENAELQEIQSPMIPVRDTLYRFRKQLSGVYEALFKEKEASLVNAMVLGDKASLDADIKQLYQRNGIAHLIAISGLHIAMIGGTLYHILRKWLGSYPVAAGIGIVFIVLYGLMTGLSGATFRAVIMLILSIGAEVYGRQYDTLTAIAAALLLMLINNPWQISQAGFLLSFGAVIGIAVVNPVWKQIFGGYPGCLDGLMISISVQIVLLPIMLYYFYEIPVYGVLLNVIVIPLMSVLLALLLLCGVIGNFFLEGAVVFAKAAQFIFWIYEKLCGITEKLPFHTICTGRPSKVWILCYYSILLLFLIAGYRKRRGKVFAGILYVCMFVTFLFPAPLKVCMFDVGQGDGIYIRTPGRKHILMDGGSSSEQKVGTYVLKNGVKYYGGAALDYVFISHSDSDHYSGIAELLEDDTVRIQNLVLPAISNPDEAYLDLEQLAAENECHIYYMKKGDELKIDGVTFHCLNPADKKYEDKNQGSIVLLMSYCSFDMLFTGDMDSEVEKEIEGQIMQPVEILKVSHHGSATASSEPFLRKISPAAACVSVEKNNRYGHPAKEVMERLERFCKKIYLTKDNGAITIDTNGETYQITTFYRTEQ